MNISEIVKKIISQLILIIFGSKKSLNKSTSVKYIEWKKGDNIQISKHFNSSEFDCKCKNESCVNQKISIDLINRLESIREEIKQPLIITSAFRCKKHQDFLRKNGVATVVAKSTSQHELGEAADITKKQRNDIRTDFLKIVEKQFQTIGLSNSFLHVDTRKEYRRWEY